MPRQEQEPLHKLTRIANPSRARREDDEDNKNMWRRGLSLPEPKNPERRNPVKPMHQKNQEASTTTNPKSFKFVPAPAPKASAWGSVPKPSSVAPLVETSAAIAVKENKIAGVGGPGSSPVAAPAIASASQQPSPAHPPKRPSKEQEKKPVPVVPTKSAWGVVPKPTAVPLTKISYPSLQQQDNPANASKLKSKKAKGGGTLGIPKALLKKGPTSSHAAPPKPQPWSTAKPKAKASSEEFPALSATAETTKKAPKKAKPAPTNQTTSPITKKKQKPSSTGNKNKKASKKTASSTTPTTSAKQSTPVVLDAHRSGMLFGSEVLQHMQLVGKGRQRIRPRTKKFSSLKKKVLEERLQKYRATLATTTTTDVAASTVVFLLNYVRPDEDMLSDPDEYQELVDNVNDMAKKVGEVVRVWVAETGCAVQFHTSAEAQAAVECWDKLLVGGSELICRLWDRPENGNMNEEEWKEWCGLQATKEGTSGDAATSEIILEAMLSEEDLEDEDCLEESLGDIRDLASKFGHVEDVTVVDTVNVRIAYSGADTAKSAAEKLGKLMLGGQQLEAKALQSGDDANLIAQVVLSNILTADDLEDEDCLQESLEDLKELAGKFGSVESLGLFEGDRVQVCYASLEEAQKASTGFHGMVIGGQTIDAVLANGSASVEPAPTPEPPKTLYSGDKIIPERFAECKRVPKIVNTQTPRSYAASSYPAEQADTVKELLRGMLGELMRLQKRAAESEKTNSKARRRLVMGLREVARGIRSHKVKMVVMANNLDEYGALDVKLQEILELCTQENVPIFFEFTKRTLGKAIGKSIKIAVVGIQNADGAHQEFKKLNKIFGV